jgi:hypothetical protein
MTTRSPARTREVRAPGSPGALKPDPIRDEIARLGDLDLDALRLRWRKLLRASAPPQDPVGGTAAPRKLMMLLPGVRTRGRRFDSDLVFCKPGIRATKRNSPPKPAGLELLPKAKAARPDVPVIMISAYGDAQGARRRRQVPADEAD